MSNQGKRKFGDFIMKDIYNRNVYVGDCVDLIDSYGLQSNIRRFIAVGETGGANLRILVLYPAYSYNHHTHKRVYGDCEVSDSHIGRHLVLLAPNCPATARNPDHYRYINDFSAIQDKEVIKKTFNGFLDQLDAKVLKRLELTKEDY